VIVAIAYAPTPAVWKQTGGVGTVKKVTLVPDPAVVGKNTSTILDIDYEADSVTGGTFTIVIYLGSAAVDKVTGDVCTTVPKGCPIAPGEVNATTIVQPIAVEIPGEYRSETSIDVKLSKTPSQTTTLAAIECNFTIVKA